VHIFDYSIVVLYLLVMVFFGLRMRKKASEGIESYFLGNRSMPWWILGSSGMVSNFDVAGTAINTALFFVMGISGYWIEIRGGIGLYLAFLMIVMGKWNRRGQVRNSRYTLLFGATRPILGSLADDCFSHGLYCFQWLLWSAAH